jgi:Pyruvate/2-oxoacid:ferredoxin oxidoreductase delta subunit
MKLEEQITLQIGLYEGPGSLPLAAAERYTTLRTLLDAGFSVSRLGAGDQFGPSHAASVCLGQFTEPASAPLPGVRRQNLRSTEPAEILAAVDEARQAGDAITPGGWKPWFPVIDYDRCTNCMQCLSFCLFGVYGVDDQNRIQVQNNDNCKTNCPACSRVCPEAAIMFPKYKAGPINGDVVSAADLEREKMKIDISSLLGGDVYQMLRDRSEKARSRFSKERDSDKALKERQKCLTKLAAAGDIPVEVLMSLPSPDEIQRRAQEAQAKAQAALRNNAAT